MTSTLPPVTVRPVRDTDTAELLQLNNAAVPAVNALDADSLTAILADCHLALAVSTETGLDDVLGFAILFAAGADYASENYRWFSGQAEHFLYVDRIVVAPEHRGLGIGALLYSAVFDAARELDAPVVFCEVNLQPPNPRSLEFHSRLGFTELDRQTTKNGTVVVSLLAAPVDQARSAPPAPV